MTISRYNMGDLHVDSNSRFYVGTTTLKLNQLYDGGFANTFHFYNINYTQLAAASLTNDIEIINLTNTGYIDKVQVYHYDNFVGGAIATYTLSVGITGDLTNLTAAWNVHSGQSATNFQITNVGKIFDMQNNTSIRLAAVSTGANLDQATAGGVIVAVSYAQTSPA